MIPRVANKYLTKWENGPAYLCCLGRRIRFSVSSQNIQGGRAIAKGKKPVWLVVVDCPNTGAQKACTYASESMVVLWRHLVFDLESWWPNDSACQRGRHVGEITQLFRHGRRKSRLVLPTEGRGVDLKPLRGGPPNSPYKPLKSMPTLGTLVSSYR